MNTTPTVLSTSTIIAVDSDNDSFVLDVDKDTLKNAPGFDVDNRPDFADQTIADTHANDYR